MTIYFEQDPPRPAAAPLRKPWWSLSAATQRTILRWIHILFSIPIIGYIYSPFDQIPNYARPTRFVFVPVLALSGLWMWKGYVLRRLFKEAGLRRRYKRVGTIQHLCLVRLRRFWVAHLDAWERRLNRKH